MSIDLKPCPFCGSEAWLNEHVGRIASGHYAANAACTSCYEVSTDVVYMNTKEEAAKVAIAEWNTRWRDPGAENALQQLIEERDDALSYARDMEAQNAELLKKHVHLPYAADDGQWRCVTCGQPCQDGKPGKLEPVSSEVLPRHPISVLLNEIDCRIEHGAESNGHLNYVHKELKKILS